MAFAEPHGGGPRLDLSAHRGYLVDFLGKKRIFIVDWHGFSTKSQAYSADHKGILGQGFCRFMIFQRAKFFVTCILIVFAAIHFCNSHNAALKPPCLLCSTFYSLHGASGTRTGAKRQIFPKIRVVPLHDANHIALSHGFRLLHLQTARCNHWRKGKEIMGTHLHCRRDTMMIYRDTDTSGIGFLILAYFSSNHFSKS